MVGVVVALSREPKGRRRAIHLLIAYLCGAHLLVALGERDAWPFSTYRILHGIASIDLPLWRVELMGVDAAGREWRTDPGSWVPVHDLTVQYWLYGYFGMMPAPARMHILAFLFSRAEAARQLAITGAHVGFERYLGAFAAPHWYILPAVKEVSPEPYRALRLYFVEWTARKRLATPPRGERYLVAEYRK